MTCALYDHGLDWTAPVSEMVGANGHIRIFHFTLYEFALSNIFLFHYTSGPEREKQTYIHFSFQKANSIVILSFTSFSASSGTTGISVFKT